MKKQYRTKLLSLACAGAMALTLTACSDAGGQADSPAGDGGYRIAIVQQMDHASLDEIRAAVEAELDAKASELGVSITYETFNGQNDQSLLNQIGAQIASDSYDAVIPIASLAAQCMVNATEDQGTPIIYAAISDPETAGLTGIDRVTGTSDALDTQFILDMMLAQNPELERVGLLYSTSEPNSETPIAQAKAYLEEKGIAYEEKTGTTADEIIAAAASLAGEVDAVFTPTDNSVMAVELTIGQTFIEAGVPHYAGADSFVRNGAFATCGVNYTDLGTATADLALEVLQSGQVPEYQVVEGGIITVNTETAAALGIDPGVFDGMAAAVNEVVTTEE